MFVQDWVTAIGVLVAVSVWQPASAEQVMLTAPITQFAAGALGGIRTVVRYWVARPDRGESDYLLLGEGSGTDSVPTQIQVQGVQGDDVMLSDVDGADCTLARAAILRRGAEVVLLWAVRVFDVGRAMAGGNALPGPMHIYTYRRHDGGDAGESSPLFRADAAPIRTAAVCSSAEVQGVIDAAAREAFAVGAGAGVAPHAPASFGCSLQPRYLMFFDAGVANPLDGARPETSLRGRAKLLIDDIAAGWRHDRSLLDIAGHEDEAESRASPNIDVLRAEAVRAALIQRGVDAKAITTRGDGFAVPMVPRPGPEIQNRYVSITADPPRNGCASTPGRASTP